MKKKQMGTFIQAVLIYMKRIFKEEFTGTDPHTSHSSARVRSALSGEWWNEFLFTHKHEFLFTHKHNMSGMSFGVRLLPHGVRCFFHLTPFHQMSIGK